MLGLLLLIIWLIPLVAFLLRNALCSELVKHIQKGNRLYQICAAICVVGIVAWGGVKPNMSMDSNSTAQNINGTNINTLNSTIGANSSTSFSDVELASGLVFLNGGTNTSFIATAPTNAIVNQKWVMTGAAEDFFFVSPTNWSFYINEKTYSNLFVSTTGNIAFDKPVTRTTAFTNQYSVLSPFRSVQGVLPYHLWNELGTDKASRFWYATTEYNSLLLTWENFLYLRNANYPISYQAELFKNGEFEFRYDLSSLQSNPTNAFIGCQVGDIANQYTNITSQIKSIKAKRLDSSIANNNDSDNDGLSDSDEVLIYGTDPTLADSDFDGMSDNQELLTGSNPLNPDEDGDGNRDYLTPELSNPEGIVVSTLREASAVFVFDTILPEGSYATLVINSTIIPLTSQSQIYLYFEGGRLYNYELHVPRNVIPNFSFLDADRLVNSTFSLKGADAEAQEASNEEEDKIMSEVQKVIYTIDDEPLKYNGNVGDASIEFVHLPGSTLFPIQSPCIHGNEEISVLLRTVPSEFLAKGEIIDVDNLVHEGNNIYTMAVDGIGYDNRNYGSITYRCPESNEEVTVYVNAHICESNANAYCYGCGVYHKNGTCPIHTGMCQVPYVVSTNCTCELELVEIKLCDVNANGVEDRYDDLASNIKTLKLIDNVEGCCCRDYAISEIRNVSLGNGLNNIETNQTTDTINVVGRNHSGQIGYTTIDYDVYRSDGEKVNSITKKALVLGLDLMFDYNDDGVINSEDKQLQYYHSISNYYVSASSEIFPIRIKAEIPPNLTAGCSSPNLNLFNDADGEIPYEQSTVLTNGIYNLYYQSSLTNANTSINLGCNNYLEKTQNITFVDTTLTNLTARFGDAIELPYYGSEMINHICIYDKETSNLCEEIYSDGKWIVGIPQGEYRLVIYYGDIYRDGVKGFAEECTLIVMGSNSVVGDYGLKCGTNNLLRIDVMNEDNLPFEITWKISPAEPNGAKLSLSEDSSKAHQIQTNRSRLFVHSGTATNNYTISGWIGEHEVVPSTDISVHVFPYEIDAPDQIVRSHSIKSAQIGVETLSEYSNHKWKLTKTYDFDGNTTQKSFIGTNINDINYVDITGFKIYFGSNKAGEKYNLTATHELYTNVTDTVELRTCDIFFNPISCKLSPNGDIINPRTILHGDDFSTYELTVFPDDFLTSKVEWETHQNLVVNEDNDKNLTIGIKSLIPYSQAYQATLTINIPDYYETPPTTKIYVYNKLDVVNIELVIVKYNDSQYINYNEDNVNASEYDFSSANDFYSVFSTNFNEQLSYANKVFRQAGIQFKVSNTNEIVNSDIFFFSTTATNTPIQSLLPSYNGIRVFVVDSITNANYYAITRHNNDWSKLYGIVLTKDMPVQTLAHELGHAFSLNDIYDHNSTVTLRRIPPNGHLTQDFTGEINYYNSELYDIVTACLMNGTDGDNPDIRNTILPIGRILGFKAINNSGCENCFNKLEDNESINCTTCLGDIRVGISNMIRNITTYGEGNE